MSADRREEGLNAKFRVERLTPSSRGIDHTDCRYFVLDPQHDPGARFALRAYKVWARKNGYERLADDLEEWLDSVSGAETVEERLVAMKARLEQQES